LSDFCFGGTGFASISAAINAFRRVRTSKNSTCRAMTVRQVWALQQAILIGGAKQN